MNGDTIFINIAARWMMQLDKENFNGFFSDKKIKIKLFNDRGANKSIWGYAELDKMTIGINRSIVDHFTIAEIKDTILHEMIHLFIRATYDNGYMVCGDDRQEFISLCRKMDCLPVGRQYWDTKVTSIPKRPFAVCFDCGAVLPTTIRDCLVCGCKHLKVFSSKRLNRSVRIGMNGV